MMKNNEGYALPFVLIVMVIICLVGISIMSSSLNNLQNQQASIERMQDQYEAAGNIEKLMAAIKENGCVSEEVINSYNIDLVGEGTKFVYDTGDESKGNYNMRTLMFSLRAKSEMTEILCTVRITGIIDESFESSGVYTIKNIEKHATKIDPIYDYLSYEIISVAGEGENEK